MEAGDPPCLGLDSLEISPDGQQHKCRTTIALMIEADSDNSRHTAQLELELRGKINRIGHVQAVMFVAP